MSAANLEENKPVLCGFGQQKLIFVITLSLDGVCSYLHRL